MSKLGPSLLKTYCCNGSLPLENLPSYTHPLHLQWLYDKIQPLLMECSERSDKISVLKLCSISDGMSIMSSTTGIGFLLVVFPLIVPISGPKILSAKSMLLL